MRLFLCLAVLLVGVAQAQERQPGQDVNFYSRDKELALGQQLASSFGRQTTPLDVADVSEYVKRVGSNLAAHFPGDWTYRIEVVREDRGGPTHEPVAFPGGPIFVSLDLLKTAQSESEFAGMLAHAMAHVASRHATRLATKTELAGTDPSAAAPMGMLAFRRSTEREADYWAVKAMAAAGYDPAALASYIARVQISPRQGSVFETLPPREERVHAIETEFRQLPAATYPTGDEFARIQSEIK